MNSAVIAVIFSKVLLSLFQSLVKKFPNGEVLKMKKGKSSKFIFLICALLFLNFNGFAQQMESQEISEVEGIPVIIKHLPDWENARNRATFITNSDDLRKALGERPVFELIEFSGGTEAVTAPYPQGRLLIVEYSTPQASVDADNKILQKLTETGQNPPVFYRRIGNYNVFVFDGTDESAANALFDEIKYEKTVQWLGEDPTLLQRAGRAFAATTADILISTVYVIVGGLSSAIFTGIIVGIIFYHIRKQKRAGMKEFSDAGGLTRLNLDQLTPDISPDRLLKG